MEQEELYINGWDLQINSPENGINKDFIGIWDDIFQEDYCNFLINFIEKTNFYTARSNPNRQDRQVDIQAFFSRASQHMMVGIKACLDEYRIWYPELMNLDLHSSVNLLQKTLPKQGYHTFHSENTTLESLHRTLVWMVYLNDVDEGGETEFLYQQVKIKPKRGTVVIWPGGFTHLHRGNPPLKNKYIATGWLSADPVGNTIRTY